MLPHRCIGIKPGMPPLLECPFFLRVVSSKVSRTSPFLSPENSFSKNRRQTVCALSPGKLNCNGYCAQCNLSQPIRSSPALLPLSSNRQNDRVYPQVLPPKPCSK